MTILAWVHVREDDAAAPENWGQYRFAAALSVGDKFSLWRDQALRFLIVESFAHTPIPVAPDPQHQLVPPSGEPFIYLTAIPDPDDD